MFSRAITGERWPASCRINKRRGKGQPKGPLVSEYTEFHFSEYIFQVGTAVREYVRVEHAQREAEGSGDH